MLFLACFAQTEYLYTINRQNIHAMIQQIEFSLTARRRGCHLVTREIMDKLPRLPKTGLLNIFVKHTSCALTINENADPDVRTDMDKIMDDIVKENQPWYDHTMEGPDDMPAHAKSSIFGGKRIRDASRYTSKNIAQVFILERYFFVSICPAVIPGTCLAVFLVAVLPLCL